MSAGLLAASQHLSLYPVDSINDVAKIFFLIDEHEMWNTVLKSHALFNP
jgi:hypothetical protein